MTELVQTPYGVMTDDRRLISLSDLCASNGGVQTGPFGSQLHLSDYVDDGIPIVTVEHLGDRKINGDEAPKVSPEDVARLSKYSLEEGDIVFSRVGSVDRCSLVTSSEAGWLFSGRCLRVRPKKAEVDSIFLSYFFRFDRFKEHIRAIAVGATMPSINTEILRGVKVPVPPMVEQRAIAGVLGALDDKIESNSRMADLLIRLARTMMSVGQYEVRLGDIAKCEKGLSYKGNGLEEKASLGIPMINLANFGVDGWLDAEKMKFYSGDYKERHLLKAGDLVVANTDLTQQRVIIGRPALVPPELGAAIFTHHVTAIRPIEDEALALPIWAQLNTPGFRERAEGFATGTTVAGLPVETLLDFQVQIPNGGVIRDARELLQRVWAAEAESKSLTLTRDALLPELLSGRLRVRDTESMMENV